VNVASREVEILVRDLVRLLKDLSGLYSELAMHMQNKFDAMKRADSSQMEAITAREMVLAGRVSEREGLRRQITRRIVEGLGLDSEQAKTTTLTSIAGYLAEPIRSQLLVTAAGLKSKLDEVERLRAKSAMVTQEMLKHLGEVFSVMRSGGQGADVYSRRGQREQAGPANVFEAVG